jgi:regulator of protease activity HflC (stomatin/prohibitin superfamily)
MGALIFLIVLVIGGFISILVGGALAVGSPPLGAAVGFALIVVTFIVAFLLASMVRMTPQWQRVVLLRLGRFGRVTGPGIWFMIPIVESIAQVIDVRTVTTPLTAEGAITRDTVPVNVDSVIFWRVVEPGRAALQVGNFSQAVVQAAEAAMRDVIGRSTLNTLLSDRTSVDTILRQIIDQQTEPWGIQVESVQLKNIKIPSDLQQAMSQQAQAEREKQARIILAQSETESAQKFVEAAEIYRTNPAAMHLRGMNILYEGLKAGRTTLMIVPSSAIDSMNLGALALGGLNASMGGDGAPAAERPAT